MDPDARELKYERTQSENTSLNKEEYHGAGIDRSLALGGDSGTTYKGQGETTEWEDILVKKGIIDRPEREVEEVQYIAGRADKSNEEGDSFHGTGDLKDAGQDELEDELDDLLDDGIFMQKFREQRIAQMQENATKNKFGDIKHLEKSDWIRDVTEASKDCWVLAFLYEDGHTECRVMEEALKILAPKHKYVKFVKIKSTACVENWPERNLPTLFMYHENDLRQQLLTLAKVGGKQMTADDLEWYLAKEYGILNTDLEEDPRLSKPAINLRRNFVGGRRDEEDD